MWLEPLLLLLLSLSGGSDARTTLRPGAEVQVTEGMIILTNQDKRLGCGFTSVVCGHSEICLVLSIFFTGRQGGLLSDRVVWIANRDAPVPPSSYFIFRRDGNLVLTGANKVYWASNTQGSGADKLTLKHDGNMVLTTANGRQRLRVGMKMETKSNNRNATKGMFFLAVARKNVTLNVRVSDKVSVPYGVWKLPRSKNNATIAYMNLFHSGFLHILQDDQTTLDILRKVRNKQMKEILYLQLAYDGSLRLHYRDKKGGFQTVPLNTGNAGNKFQVAQRNGVCNLPMRCQEYGVCSSKGKQCSCIQNEKGQCLPLVRDKSTACWNGTGYWMQELVDVDYFPTRFVTGKTMNSSKECKQECLQNCHCKAAFFKVLLSNSTQAAGKCYSFSFVLTLFNTTPVANTKTYPWKTTAYLKISMKLEPSRERDKRIIWVPVSVAAFTVLTLVVLAVCWRRTYSTRKDEILEAIPGLPRRFSFRELYEATEKFTNKLGSGAFSSVFLGRLQNGTKVAVKRLHKKADGGDNKQFRSEVITVASVRHCNLVKLIGFCHESRHTLLIYEFMPNGSLDKWIFGSNLRWERRFAIALDIARGLCYLHEGCEKSILHLDIKPQNILLDTAFKAKISDFGLSIFSAAKDSSTSMVMARGTPGYMAPEWWKSCNASRKIDVYSYGIVLLELVSGRKALEFLEAMVLACGEQGQEIYSSRIGSRKIVQLVDAKVYKGAAADACDVVQEEEVTRMVRVALCCVQDEACRRPSMGCVVKMLEGSIQVPDALVSLKHQALLLPSGIASFLASWRSTLQGKV